MRRDSIRGRIAPNTIARAITQALDDATAVQHSAASPRSGLAHRYCPLWHAWHGRDPKDPKGAVRIGLAGMTMAHGSRVRVLSNIEPWAFTWPWENVFWGLRYASVGDWHRAATHIWAPAKRTPSVQSCERAAKAARAFDDAMTQALANTPGAIEFDGWTSFAEEAARLREHVAPALCALEHDAMHVAGRGTTGDRGAQGGHTGVRRGRATRLDTVERDTGASPAPG